MGLRFLISAALLLFLVAEPTLQIKLDNAGRGRSRSAGGRRRNGGLGVQIGRGRGIQIGRGAAGGGMDRSNSRGGTGGGGLSIGGGGLSVGGGQNEDISSRRPQPESDYDGADTEKVVPQSFERLKVSVAVVLPYSVFKKKSYTKKIIQVGFPKESKSMIDQSTQSTFSPQAANALRGSPFMAKYDLYPHLEMLQPIPAPTEVSQSC